MSPRPIILAAVVAALSTLWWLSSDIIELTQPTNWEAREELVAGRLGSDSRVGTLARLIADGHASASSRTDLHVLLTALADERLISLAGIDRELEPAIARAVLGQELDDFITDPDPGLVSLSEDRLSLLVNRIESL